MPQVPRYEDFTLGFTADPEDPARFQVTIRQAPCSGPDGTFRMPFPPEELDELLSGLEGQIAGLQASRHLESLGAVALRITPEEVGHRLYTALFQGDVEHSFLESRERVRHRPSTGLRLRLVIDPEAPGGALLASVPWELLHRRETRDHLSRNLWSPIVRFLVTRETPRPVTRDEGLRILLVSANPQGSASLDLAGEAAELVAAWSDRELSVYHLADPSVGKGDLRQAIRRMDPHVLHFMGHGGFDERSGEGGLVLGARHELPRVYTAEVLQGDVRASSSLRLVCLNACTSGRLPRRGGQDPFSGLASSLVMAGVPAVVAMQFPVSDRAALAFSSGLYRALAAGDPVDAAVTEGRMAAFAQDPNSWEWATPALYLSVPDGRLFSTHDEEPATPRSDCYSAAAPTLQKRFVAEHNELVLQGENISVGTLTSGGSNPPASGKGQ